MIRVSVNSTKKHGAPNTEGTSNTPIRVDSAWLCKPQIAAEEVYAWFPPLPPDHNRAVVAELGIMGIVNGETSKDINRRRAS